MIDVTTIAWIAFGLAAGFLHATMLRRTTHQLTAWTPVLGMLRLGTVATALIVAALAGSILAAASGWAIGFVVGISWFAMRRSNRDSGRMKVPEAE